MRLNLGTYPKELVPLILLFSRNSKASNVRFILRGRGKRRNSNKFCQDLPLYYAESIAVYVEPRKKG